MMQATCKVRSGYIFSNIPFIASRFMIGFVLDIENAYFACAQNSSNNNELINKELYY